MKFAKLKCITAIALFTLLSSVAFAGETWYVNGTSGSDSNACTSAMSACKTVGHAISLAAASDSIKVAAATYTENLTIGISLKILGSGASTTIIDGGAVGGVVTISRAKAHVTLSKVTIRNGLSSTFGGGISNLGTLKVINSTVTENVVSCSEDCGVVGGGIYNYPGATLTISNSLVEDNAAQAHCFGSCSAEGGGIANRGGLTINNSTISGNAASVTGQTIYSAGGAIYNFGTIRINNSTFGGNGAEYGGAIYNVGTVSINNSTLGGNGAEYDGGAIVNKGTVMINSSTLGGNNSGRSGGGIFNYTAMAVQNSIVANNTHGNCFLHQSLTSNGYNMSSDNSCNLSNAGDLNNTDPMLGPLQDNGGPTQTMALPSGSPAIDAGNPNGCTDDKGHLLKTDQRGKPRPDEQSGRCDMGAYEGQSH